MEEDNTLRNTIYVGLGLLALWGLYALKNKKSKPAAPSTYRKLAPTYEVEGLEAHMIGPEGEYEEEYPERKEREHTRRERGTSMRPPDIPIFTFEHGEARKLAPTRIRMIIPDNPLAEYTMESHGDKYATDGKILLLDRSPREVADWSSELEVRGELTREKVDEVWPKDIGHYVPVPYPDYIELAGADTISYIYITKYPFGLNARYVNWAKKENYQLLYDRNIDKKPLILRRHGRHAGLLMPRSPDDELLTELKKHRLI